MLGIVIDIVVEGLTGFGIAHQIGLRRLPHRVSSLLLLSLSTYLVAFSLGSPREAFCAEPGLGTDASAYHF